MKIRLSVRLYTGAGEKCFGPGIAQLLTRVTECGSIRQAARSMDMAYSKAWTILRECERALGEPLLFRQVGGAEGGKSVLTEKGRTLLFKYREIEEKLGLFSQELMADENDSRPSKGV